MTLKNRFLLVSFGVVIFIIATPIAVLYALGYKYDFQAKEIVKTGSLVVRSDPRGSEIYINNILHRRKTDATIRFLLPGDYNIEIKKDGYQPWTKRLSILSELVTWSNFDRDFIALFYKDPKKILDRKISQATVSPNFESAVVTTEGVVSNFNPDKNSLQKINDFTPPAQPVEINNNETLYYALRYPSSRAYAYERLAAASKFTANDAYALILENNILYRAKNSTISLVSGNVSGFALENEHLWYIEGNLLKHANLDIGVVQTIATLPYSPTNSKIIRGDSHIFLILDNTAYSYDDSIKEIYRGVTNAYWSDNAARLVMYNNNEILHFEPNSARTELIIRSSTPISNPILNSRTGYMFFANESRVKAIELDGRDHRNVYTIAVLPEGQFMINDDGDKLYILGRDSLSEYEIR